MRVRQLLLDKSRTQFAVRPETPVAEFAAAVAGRRIGAAPVIDGDGMLLGVISERDVVRGYVAHGAGLGELRVRDLMSDDVVACYPQTDIADALSLMTENGIRHIPVVEGERLAGFVSIGDVAATRVTQLELDNEALREMLMNYETIG